MRNNLFKRKPKECPMPTGAWVSYVLAPHGWHPVGAFKDKDQATGYLRVEWRGCRSKAKFLRVKK